MENTNSAGLRLQSSIVNNPVRVFIILALIEGLVFLLFLPIGRTPDDQAHFMMLQEAFGVHGYDDEFHYFMLDSTVQAYSEGRDMDAGTYWEAGNAAINGGLEFIGAPSVSLVKYLPGGIGILIGGFLGLPIMWVVYLSKAFAFAFFIFMGVMILRVTPIRKGLFLFLLLMPMNVQQCISINPDAVLNLCSFLFIALILKYKQEEERVRWKDLGLLFLLFVVITISKVVYAFMGLLVFLIPLSHFELPLGERIRAEAVFKKIRIPLAVIFLAAVVAGLYLLREVGYVKVFMAALLEPMRTAYLVVNTLGNFFLYYLQTFVGSFGYLDVYVGWWFVVVFFAMVLLLILFRQGDQAPTVRLPAGNRVLMVCVFILCGLFIVISQFDWTIFLMDLPKDVDILTYRGYLHQFTMSLGVQGRYFIPIFPLVALAVSADFKGIPHRWIERVQFVYYPVMVCYVTYTVFTCYWA